MPDVAKWGRENADRLNIVLVSRGSQADNEKKFGSSAPGPILLQKRYEVADLYGSPATPSAVLIDADGRFASRMAPGPEAIRQLVERAIRPPVGPAMSALQAGAPLPQLSLPTLDGGYLALQERVGQPTVLLFWNPGCGFCNQLVPELKAWAANYPAGTDHLVFVSTDDPDANRSQTLPGTVVMDGDFSTARMFGATGTPSAVLIDTDARIASPLAVGRDAILRMLSQLEATVISTASEPSYN
jgi:thiol-disulfide isomerase/thioredoxin